MSLLRINIENDVYIYDGMSHDFYELENLEEIKSLQNDDFRNFKLEHMSNYEKQIIDVLNKDAATLILETTEKCNLRCSYCVFSEDYEGEREHTNISMQESVAIEAINNFKQRSKKPYIVFYGGEPLMNFLLIKKSVEHANKIFDTVHYSMTTNGTLLLPKIFNFFIENNFMITISLDGLQRIHDKYRTFKNGKPSWNIIIQKLRALKEYNPDFYATNISFNCVIPNEEDIEEINEFFKSDDLFKDNKFRFSSTIQNAWDYNVAKNRMRIVKMLEEKTLTENVFDMDYIGTLIQKVIYRKEEDSKKECVPFGNRTFVRANGDMQFCERIGGTYGRTTSAEELNEFAVALHTKYNEFIKDDCSKCWAYRFCEHCPASVTREGVLDKSLMRTKCGNFISKMSFAIWMSIS